MRAQFPLLIVKGRRCMLTPCLFSSLCVHLPVNLNVSTRGTLISPNQLSLHPWAGPLHRQLSKLPGNSNTQHRLRNCSSVRLSLLMKMHLLCLPHQALLRLVLDVYTQSKYIWKGKLVKERETQCKGLEDTSLPFFPSFHHLVDLGGGAWRDCGVLGRGCLRVHRLQFSGPGAASDLQIRVWPAMWLHTVIKKFENANLKVRFPQEAFSELMIFDWRISG